MDALIFENSHMVGVSGKITKAGLVNKVEWAAVCTAKIAEAMGARWVVFDKEQTIKEGFTKIELDYGMNANTLRFVPEGNLAEHVLNLSGEQATSFKLVRKGDGKKKSKKLLVTFKIVHSGSQIPLVEYLERMGGVIGRLELKPNAVQPTLPGAAVDPKAKLEQVKQAKRGGTTVVQ